MVRHVKKPKVSRIRVAAFKKRMNDIKRQKNPNSLATKMYNSSVINCTIPKATDTITIEEPWGKVEVAKGTAEFKIPKEGFKQPRCLRHRQKGQKWINGALVKWNHKSEYPQYKSPKMTRKKLIVLLIEDKLKKWEKKNPCPIKDEKQKDLFETEFLPKWKAERELAEKHIRDFVVSVYDKLTLYTRHASNGVYTGEKKAAELKDKIGEGHNLSKMPTSSPLYKKAAGIINNKKKNDKTVVAGRIVGHDKKHGRIILGSSPVLLKKAA